MQQSIYDITFFAYCVVPTAVLILGAFLLALKKLTKTRFLRFLGILLIGTASSLIPFGPLGVVLGFPAVIIAALLTSIVLDKE